MPTIYPIVDEGLGNSAYVVELGDGRALVMDPARDPPRTCSSPWTKAPSMPIRCARCPHRDVAPIPNRSWMVPSVRALTPEEAGRLLARFRLVGPRAVPARHRPAVRGAGRATPPRRVRLDRPLPVLQVVDTRYQAGRFGSGFKPRPATPASASSPGPSVVEAIGCRLPPGGDPSSLVFTGPGDGPGRPGGVEVPKPGPCCRANCRTYQAALAS